jgi:Ser/Thr protein kinase RdoA (MazF antagonist)
MTAAEVNAPQAEQLAADVWGVMSHAEQLPGWSDRNFLLTAASGDRFVLKVAPPNTPRDALEVEASALSHLASSSVAALVPRVVPGSDGQVIHEVDTLEGLPYRVRLLTFLEGRPLVELGTRSPRLLSEIGATLATLSAALTDFRHPATRRTHEWDVMATPDLTPLTRHIDDAESRRTVASQIDRFASRVLPRRGRLEHGVIHGDANDHNLLVVAEGNRARLAGIIDFSDLSIAPRVADLAISLAYLMLDRDDPLDDARHVIHGYHAVRPLTALERELLPDLVIARVCSSLLHAAHGHARDPANTYLQVSAAPMWRLLETLVATERERFGRTVKAACR